MLKSVVLASVAVASLTAFATGASAQANVTPMMGAGYQANEAIVIQRGGNNTTDVTQSGTNNKAGKLNNVIDLSFSNLSTGYASSSLDGADSVVQKGDYNSLTISQSGSDNSIVTASNGVSRTDFSPSLTGGSFQNGNNNTVNSDQRGTRGQVQFQQGSNYNTASFFAAKDSQNTYAGIFQFTGDSNTGTINQRNNADNAYAIIVQNGSNNTGLVNQNGQNNYAVIGQLSSYNNGTIDQAGSTNYAVLLQADGNNNTATITQTGTSSSVGALAYQSGAFNTGSINQSGTSANAAFAQIGNSNAMTIKQR
ncbi:hypothetical protein OMR07_21315 [Methylobacterium organophilum]|nr:hypothetical protein [Methylobacterium organophilum]